jgi:hypothetical protein
MWRGNARSAADELAADCEAFLAGRYLEYLTRRGQPIPGWAWTNPLAHAPEEQLRSMISTRGQSMGPPSRWRHACCYVAGQLLDLAERRGPLAALQATALVPLELELISRRDVSGWNPSTWVTTVMAVLADHRWTRRGTAL